MDDPPSLTTSAVRSGSRARAAFSSLAVVRARRTVIREGGVVSVVPEHAAATETQRAAIKILKLME